MIKIWPNISLQKIAWEYYKIEAINSAVQLSRSLTSEICIFDNAISSRNNSKSSSNQYNNNNNNNNNSNNIM